MLTPDEIIRILDLKPLSIEGGFYHETWRSEEVISSNTLPDRYKGESRSFGTAIYYLLKSGSVSSIHRLPTDEIFHFYLGGPVVMLRLFADGLSDVIEIGTELKKGQHPQVVVPRGTWFGCFLNDGVEYALMGTTMAPGFDFADYETGKRDELIRQYPERKELILRLT